MQRSLLYLVGLVGLLLPAVASADIRTILVDEDKVQCPKAVATSLQEGINKANPGDVVRVCAGTYGGGAIINKAGLMLRADTKTGPVKIVGAGANGPRNGLTVIANSVRIDGFEISGFSGQTNASGIFVGGTSVGDTAHPADAASITNNTIFGNGYGIYLWQSNGNRVSDNVIRNQISFGNDGGNGIFAFAGTGDAQVGAANAGGRSGTGNRISENTVTGNARRGIFAGACTDACVAGSSIHANIAGTRIEKNTVSGNGTLSSAEAIGLLGASGGEISKNKVTANLRHGILINASDNAQVTSNTVTNNSPADSTFSGIRINRTDETLVKNNILTGNGRGIRATLTTDTTFKGNKASSNLGTDLDIENIATNDFSRNVCTTASPSTDAWDCRS